MSIPLPPASPDEKDSSFANTPLDSTSEVEFSYTEAEEKRVRLKLNLTVLPLLFLGFYVFQLERGNISNALTDGFMPKVGITQDQFNTGQALLFVGIILGELPSQYVLQWIGPRVSHPICRSSRKEPVKLTISFGYRFRSWLSAWSPPFKHSRKTTLPSSLLEYFSE
jgi:hypothetical protein